jgi:hypothetical protein
MSALDALGVSEGDTILVVAAKAGVGSFFSISLSPVPIRPTLGEP